MGREGSVYECGVGWKKVVGGGAAEIRKCFNRAKK